MDRIPVEVWERIIAFSCIDGGHTGSSLSLVSKAFHDAGQRSRYYSVALKGLPAALKFAQVLGKHPRIPMRVYHLYITDQHPYVYQPYLEPRPSLPTRAPAISYLIRAISQRVFKEKAAHAKAPKKDIVQRALAINPSQSIEGLMHAVLHAILLAIAPTLSSLSISVDFATHDPKIPPLPCLTELTLNYSFTRQRHTMAQVMGTLQPLPSLRMLDLLGLSCSCHPEEIMAQVTKVAPNLTHICLPIIRATNFKLMKPTRKRAFWKQFYGGDLTIQMQANPWSEEKWVSASRCDWDEMLGKLTRKAHRRQSQFVFYTREQPLDQCFTEQEGNWLARIDGGTGRWAHRGEALGTLMHVIEQWRQDQPAKKRHRSMPWVEALERDLAQRT